MTVIRSFCSVFSIRLGSIIVGALSLMQAAVMEVACIIGLQDVHGVSQNLNEFMNEKDFLFATSFFNSVKKNPEPFLTGTLIILVVYSFSCILLIVGALKLNVWLVAPFVAVEFVRLCANLAILVAGMLILKKNSLDLGPLMGGSCGGGFFMLLMMYLWTCPLSLAQELVRLRRRQEAPARTRSSKGSPARARVLTDATGLEAKLWRHTTHVTQYPYAPQYPPYRGYPIYIE
ncbi:Protein BEAN1 [Frankliniella fusca]|uniref:Protein BEAN1 n=1 Tax=Frankliniella fusca TaxID=407009 RepID=A0AAE1HMW7_9NEOP|nr:Protein BEAN1 [Frankliniella fusca]